MDANKIFHVICIQCTRIWTKNVYVQDKYLKKIINFHLDSITFSKIWIYTTICSPVVRSTINLKFNKIDFYDTENMVDNCKLIPLN